MSGGRCRNEPTDGQIAEIRAVAWKSALASGAAWHEADEVAQETAVKLWLSWERTGLTAVRSSGQARWHRYIRTTSVNVHRDLIRSHVRRLDRNNRSAGGREVASTPRPGSVTRVPTNIDAIEAHLARAVICDEIRSLPVRQRAVAEMIMIDELSPREVAAKLGIQDQSVRKHLRAAKEALQRRLTEAETQAL